MAVGSTSSGVRAQIQQVNDSLYEVHRQEGTPTVQILLFHGLQSGDLCDPHLSTWKTENGSWLWEWLAEDFRGADIYTVSYQGLTESCDMYLIQESLIQDLMSANIGQFLYRPVILVGHCVGGLVIKAVCSQAHERLHLSKCKTEREKLESFLESLRGIFYYGTPHRGSSRIANASDGPLFDYFKILNKEAARLNYKFDHLCGIYGKWRIYGLGESLPTKSAEEGVDRRLGDVEVPEASSRAGDNYRVVAADHISICQPRSKIETRFSHLKKLIDETMTIIGKEEARIQEQKKKHQEAQQEETAMAQEQKRVKREQEKAILQEEAYYMVPCLQVSDYVERIDLLESAKSAVQKGREQQRLQVVVLLGMGGQGKSQLAMEYCRTARLSKEFLAIFWIDASSIKSAHRSFECIVSKIADPLRIFGSIEEKIKFVKGLVDGWDSRWLLVFDNYDAPNPDFNVAAFFPSSPFGTILVTSRHEDSKRLGKVIPLSKMTEQESLELLFRRSENELTDENMETGKSIVAKLEFLPLAIDQAGAFISAQKLPPTLFLEHFDLQKEEILKYTPALMEYRRTLDDDGKETALNVFTTWELSFQQIQKDETGERLCSFLTTVAFFNTRDIGEDLFHDANDLETVPLWIDAFISEGAWDSLKYRKELVELSKLSLLNFAIQDTKQCHFYLHPLVADWLRLRVGQDIRRVCTIESCYLLAKLIENTDLQSCGYAFCLYLLGHVDDCLNNIRTYSTLVDEDASFAEILTFQFGGLLQQTSRYREGISLVEAVLPIIETAYGKDHPSTLNTVNNLGNLYRSQGKLAEAERMYEHALTGKEKALGKGHASTLDTVNNLGLLYCSQGKLAEAERMYERALAGYEMALGKDHASTLATVNNLGNLYSDQGKLAEAERMYECALTGREKALGKDHASTLDTIHNLGNLYSNQGKLAEAERMYEHALTGKEKALGKGHASTLDTVNNLGLLYCSQGKLAEAERTYERALIGREKALGKDHASTLGTVNNLGLLYCNQWKLAEAERMYERALTGKEKALGKGHASTLETVNNLGNLYRSQGKLAEAERMYERALAGFEMALGKDHASTLDTVNNLGLLYCSQGKLAEAERTYERALIGREKALGKDHASTLATVNNLGNLYSDQGKLAKAERMYERALTGREEALGKDHASTLDTVNNLGLLYYSQWKLAEAERMYERALAGYEMALGKDHASTLTTVNNLGNLYSDQGKLAEAERMYERALTGREKALGKDHASTLDTVNNLGNLYSHQGKLAEAERMYERALTRREKAMGKDHEFTLDAVCNMAELMEKQDNLKAASQMFERAFFGYTNLLGVDNYKTIDAGQQLERISHQRQKKVNTQKSFWKSLRQCLK